MTLEIDLIEATISCSIALLIILLLLLLTHLRMNYKIVRRQMVKGEDGCWYEEQ